MEISQMVSEKKSCLMKFGSRRIDANAPKKPASAPSSAVQVIASVKIADCVVLRIESVIAEYTDGPSLYFIS